MKALLFAYSWMVLTVLILLFSIASFGFLFRPEAPEAQLAGEFEQNVLISTTNTSDLDTYGDEQAMQAIVEIEDARPKIVENFLARYNSPLTPHEYYGKKLVEIADAYQLDFRLLPSIAMQESTLCKAIPANSYNCLGFGVHSGGTLRFKSYEEGFATAARGLKLNYIDRGLVTPEQIMTKYTPHSPGGAWAKSVNRWMAEMRYDDKVLGAESEEDADLLEFVESEEKPG